MRLCTSLSGDDNMQFCYSHLTCDIEKQLALDEVFMSSPALSRQRHSVFGLSVHACVRGRTKIL